MSEPIAQPSIQPTTPTATVALAAPPFHEDGNLFVHILTSIERGVGSAEFWIRALKVIEGMGAVAGVAGVPEGALASKAAGVLLTVLQAPTTVTQMVATGSASSVALPVSDFVPSPAAAGE